MLDAFVLVTLMRGVQCSSASEHMRPGWHTPQHGRPQCFEDSSRDFCRLSRAQPRRDSKPAKRSQLRMRGVQCQRHGEASTPATGAAKQLMAAAPRQLEPLGELFASASHLGGIGGEEGHAGPWRLIATLRQRLIAKAPCRPAPGTVTSQWQLHQSSKVFSCRYMLSQLKRNRHGRDQ